MQIILNGKEKSIIQDEVIKALEKQVAKTPRVMETSLRGEKFWWYCGHCNASHHTNSRHRYCCACGGKVNWEEYLSREK